MCCPGLQHRIYGNTIRYRIRDVNPVPILGYRLTHTAQSRSAGFHVAAQQIKEIHARSALSTVPYP
ncbi:hypothetical protein DPMN_185169 [Dreissena polymorpha]|uniref:Uncharacterized protein n=1 Tax=Dreissena polymorpha TaxID=45954 RepID=A0A9D4I5A6_DREPO|nr:hypothetical protein DPMN_185169 [Dreissena polymorpha]